MQKFSFLIPCYNCEKFILSNGIKLLKKIKINNINFEIFFLNDGSKDDSLKELKKLKKKYKIIKIVNFNINKGKSAVLKKNINRTKGNIIVFYDLLTTFCITFLQYSVQYVYMLFITLL